MKPLEEYINFVGNIELSYPSDVPFNPFPHQSFNVTLCKSRVHGYYFKHSGFLGHEPKEVQRKWNSEFDDVRGSKELMIEKMDEFIDWVCKNYK